ESGRSILLLGRPGVGKTTMLREVARVLADDLGKRVVVVDTSNEIAGDGDIPHPGIGDARRMQVRTPTEQHAVMIEPAETQRPAGGTTWARCRPPPSTITASARRRPGTRPSPRSSLSAASGRTRAGGRDIRRAVREDFVRFPVAVMGGTTRADARYARCPVSG